MTASKGSNGFAKDGNVNCAGYAGSGGGTYNYKAPSERGAKGKSVKDDMETDGWSCEVMNGVTCKAPCDYEKMVISNYMSGNDRNRGSSGKMKDSFADPDVEFGHGPNGGATDIHAIYASSGCDTTYTEVLGRHPEGSSEAKPNSDVIPADYPGKKYCCKRKKK
jgi:hypothetical protein